MKKLISLLLCLMLLVPAALAADREESAPLSYEELKIYLATLPAIALQNPVTHQENEDGTVTASTDVGRLTIDTATLKESSVVSEAVLSVHQEGPRGLYLGDTLEMLLDTYPNDNPELGGTYFDAALYITGEKPEVVCGYLLRDGQRVTQVTHVIYHWQEDGSVIRCGAEYKLDQGCITGIRVFGMKDVIDEATAMQEIADCAEMQEINEYSAYPLSIAGDEVAPFVREDLYFSGLDLLELTYDEAIAVLGDSPVDDWTEDSTGDLMREKQWDGISLIFNYDAQKRFKNLDSLKINSDVIEGPRGVRVGDAMETVIYRFLHDQGGTNESGILLYGDGENPPYGICSYSEKTATLTYTQQANEKTIIWHMTFSNDTGLMTEMLFLIR